MATYNELAVDWSSLRTKDVEFWSLEDLQLAAELGKTLLERNKELENSLRHQQAVIEDQAQEIEYLNKQTIALREVNESRLRIYEQLEVSISELEKHNQKLAEENGSYKKRMKGLNQNTEVLESRCEELQRLLEEAVEREAERKLQKSRDESFSGVLVTFEDNAEILPKAVDVEEIQSRLFEEIHDLQSQLHDLNLLRQREVRQREELELELSSVLQDNSLLHSQVAGLRQSQVTSMTMQDEISRSNTGECYTCTTCLRRYPHREGSLPDMEESVKSEDLESPLQPESRDVMGYWSSTEFLSPDPILEDEVDGKLIEGSESEESVQNVSLLAELDNQYRLLIDKYEALLEARNNAVEKALSKPDVTCTPPYTHCGPDSAPTKPDPGHLSTTGTQTRLLLGDGADCPEYSRVVRRTKLDSCSDDGSSSSGYSEGRVAVVSRQVQTEADPASLWQLREAHEHAGTGPQGTPKYRRLFQEIFRVLHGPKPDELQTEDNPHQEHHDIIASRLEEVGVILGTPPSTEEVHCDKKEEKPKDPSVNACSGDSACCSDDDVSRFNGERIVRVHRKPVFEEEVKKPAKATRNSRERPKSSKRPRFNRFNLVTMNKEMPRCDTHLYDNGRSSGEVGLAFSVSAEFAILHQLEKSYADALRSGLKASSRSKLNT